MRLKELRGLPVIDPTAARKIGIVTDYQVDPTSGRLAALDISGVENGEAERVLAQRVRRVGRSAVILTGRGGTVPSAAVEVNERWLDGSTLIGLEVMGDDGNRVGRLVDAAFDQDSLNIDAYLLRSGGWASFFGQRGRIQPPKVHSCSRDLMMVDTGRVKELTTTTAGTTSDEESSTLSPRMPLKAEDRLPAPTYEQVPDGQPVSAHR
jgi:sporulation protein YlmC with PRC-barrel domain